MMEALFGPGVAAGWVTLIYFIAGAIGTAGRVALSPTLENRGVRMIVETLSGGAAGVLLPYLGAGVFGDAAAAFPPIAKAALVLVLTGSGSFAIGELLARRNGAAVKSVLALLVPTLLLAGCATGGTSLATDPIIMTAELAAIVGEQAVSTNAIYVQLCAAPPKLKAERCNAWRTFFTDFKATYGAAHATYKQALGAGNIGTAQDAARVIQALSNALLLYYIAKEGS